MKRVNILLSLTNLSIFLKIVHHKSFGPNLFWCFADDGNNDDDDAQWRVLEFVKRFEFWGRLGIVGAPMQVTQPRILITFRIN